MTGIAGIELPRVYRATTAIFLAALLVSLQFGRADAPIGLVAGTALALSVFWSWAFIVRHGFDPKSPNRGLAVAFGLLKLPLLAGAAYMLVGSAWVNAAGLAAGIAIPQVAVALLAIGKATVHPSAKERLHAAPRA